MKRSEALKVLDDALIETRYISYYPDRQKDLEFVLTALEKVGMLPPSIIDKDLTWTKLTHKWDKE